MIRSTAPVQPLAVIGSGMVTSVGLSVGSSTAAIRCGISNAHETRFIDWGGEWIKAHEVAMDRASHRGKLAAMAAAAIVESLQQAGYASTAPTFPAAVPATSPPSEMTLLLCVAEPERPGRADGLDESILPTIERVLGIRLHEASVVLAHGRAGIVTALRYARDILLEDREKMVLLAGVDSLLTWPTLQGFEVQGRLLTSQQSNGFIPGEAAGALLLRLARPDDPHMTCLGFGVATEASSVMSGEPLRGEALANAMRAAAAEAGEDCDDIDVQISDLSGEKYFFQEAALARSRLLRKRSENLDLWLPADCIGEVGAAAGPIAIAVAIEAYRKSYLPGPKVMCHFSSDAGMRAAVLMRAPGL